MLRWALRLKVDGENSPLAGLKKPVVPRVGQRGGWVWVAVAAATIAVAFMRAGDQRVAAAGGLVLGVANGAAWLRESRKVRGRLPLARLLSYDTVQPEPKNRTRATVIEVFFLAWLFIGAFSAQPWLSLVFTPLVIGAGLAIVYDMRAVAKIEQETGCAVVFDKGYKIARPYLVRTSAEAPFPAPSPTPEPPAPSRKASVSGPAIGPYLNDA